jgi:hypothetical protein
MWWVMTTGRRESPTRCLQVTDQKVEAIQRVIARLRWVTLGSRPTTNPEIDEVHLAPVPGVMQVVGGAA